MHCVAFFGCALVGVVLAGASRTLALAADEPRPPILSSSESQITDEMIGRKYPPMLLTIIAEDPKYAFSQRSPVMVGGGFGEGGHNTYRFLNALRGPNGEVVHYARIGTCCKFRTPNSPFGESALLEVYEITYAGEKPKRLYFNWYDSGEPMIPVGLSAEKPPVHD